MTLVNSTSHKISGKEVFKFLDSYGLPLDIMILEMRKNGLFFDVKEFIEAAHKSKNFENPHRLLKVLIADLPENEEYLNIVMTIERIICQIYGIIEIPTGKKR